VAFTDTNCDRNGIGKSADMMLFGMRAISLSLMSLQVAKDTLIFTVQRNRWDDNTVAEQYLRWLRSIGPEGKLTLNWDSFAAHKDAAIIDLVKTLNIDIILILLGMTDTC
jgi:hypothetical protein